MRGNIDLAPAKGHASLVARVLRTMDLSRLAVIGLVVLLLSFGSLVSPTLLDFFSPLELLLAWLSVVAELMVIAAVLLVAFTVLDESLPRAMPMRLAVVCLALLALSAVLAVLLNGYYAGGFEHPAAPLRLFADSLRWGLPAVFLALVADVHYRALQVDSAAHAAELARAQLQQAESEQQLALLQAQIEPHFLFNTLGNVRRLYRTQPQAGAAAIGGLIEYLRTALPRLRNRRASVREEVSLVRAYLGLFQVRMGTQLGFEIDIDPTLDEVEFPPMLLMTLVENAIKHGLEPVGGGHVEVRVRRRRNLLEASVIDDGAGFGAAASCGSGVGLANVRRQLAARYQGRAHLTLEGREPRGACATLVIPLAGTQAVASPAIGVAHA